MYCQFYELLCPVCGFVSNAFCIDVKCLVAWWLCLWSGNPPDISPCYILTVSAQDRTRSVSALFLYFHSTRWSPYHCTLMLCILYQNRHSALYFCMKIHAQHCISTVILRLMKNGGMLQISDICMQSFHSFVN
jgi:hypothetical protein